MAWVRQSMSGPGFVVDVEVQTLANSDGMIRTVWMTNNTSVTHYAAALYQGAWTPSPAGQACDPGQSQTIVLGNNVKAGDVQQVMVW